MDICIYIYIKGIIPRAVDGIFDAFNDANEETEFIVSASYVEIYMERIRDLLDPTKRNLQIREDPQKGIYVQNMTEEFVGCAEDMLNCMSAGKINRATAATGMNEGSSRSHSVFCIKIHQRNTETESTKSGKLYLVDLAGSEMIKKTGSTGQTLDEAKMINKSLSALGNVINALVEGGGKRNSGKHIPYRDSKLTRMLQESLGGNARYVVNAVDHNF